MIHLHASSVAMSDMDKQATLIAALQHALVFPDGVGEITLVETHISWVLLTGDYAYKIKKAVDFGFLDFSSLEKRKHFCEREVQLNQQYSDGVYLDVVAITGREEQPELNGKGEAIEYAVKMRQFASGCLFSDLADENRLQDELIEALAVRLVQTHTQARAVKSRTVKFIEKTCLGNIKALSWPPVNNANDQALVEEVGAWTLGKLNQLSDIFRERESEGFVRLCHGDLHLANITLVDNKPIFFDCIEFNDDFRTVDIQSELAFLLMDLECRQQARLANRLLNRYLQLSGDYAGLRVLNFYKVYRAMVRAKVNYLQANQDAGFKAKAYHQITYLKYLGLAKTYIHKRLPRLTITHGVSGSGKTTHATTFAAENYAIHISSDIERKRLFDLQETASSHSQISGGIYTANATQRTYIKLLDLAKHIINMGCCVIVDASFLKRKHRDMFYQLALDNKLAFQILDCEAPRHELEVRLKKRTEQGNATSEAGVEVLTEQLGKQEPLTEFERQFVLRYKKFASVI